MGREERTGSASTILPLISSLLTSCHCSSRLLSPLLQTLLNTINQPNPSTHSGSEEFPLMPQSEVLLDLLDLTGEDFKLETWGPSVTALVMRLRATALALMILQDDWTWFFGEQSEYVSHLVQNTEVILAHSTSSVLEDSRLEATRALKDYLPVLKQRSVKDMALVLQYGIANIVNAALRLLEDEEEEVGEAAASFASDLPRVQTEACTWGELSRERATETLVFWALHHLQQVSSFLLPVSSLLGPIPLLNKEDTSQKEGLFKRGDGVNVYREESYSLALYYRCIRKHLDNGGSIDGKIQVENVLDLCKALEPPLTDSSKIIPPKEVSVAGHLHLQLCLLLLHPTLAQSPLQDQQVKDLEIFKEKFDSVCLLDKLDYYG